ncbi:csd [Symbiodinium natans]|uniref:Csd protein n=1 Tax=Symbiodinium natans TaxID=878477 RepID=A0A812U436_9DINO|nr:csd [Symbiodinium natans]
MLRSVEQLGHEAVSVKNRPWLITDNGTAAQVRALFAQLVAASPDNVALAPSTSYAISQAAHNIWRSGRVRAGDVVLLLQNQMSSNVYAWQRLCRECGARLVAIPEPQHEEAVERRPKRQRTDASMSILSPWDEALETAIRLHAQRSRIAVLAVPHFLWTDGSGPINLHRLRSVLDEVAQGPRTVFVVDATQSLGVVPIHAQSWGIDWLACSVHKWLFGPYGLSLVYVAPEWSQDPATEPIVHDEHNRLGADGDVCLPFDLERPGYSEDFQEGAKKFDAGGRVNPILMPMVAGALKQVLEWHPDRIGATLAGLTARCAEGAIRMGLQVPSSHAPHFLGVGPSAEDVDRELHESGATARGRSEAAERWADAAAAYLKQHRIHVSSRAGVLRVAPHVYNTSRDIDEFLRVLASFRHRRSSR